MTQDGFEAFCEAEWPRLVGALDLHCGDLAVAEELTQETLIRVHSKWRRVQHWQSPGGFAYRVALNLANSHWRRRAAERRAHARLPDHHLVQEDPTDGIAVREALLRLPARQRAALILRYWGGMSAGEAADVLEISPGALRALTHRAMEQMRQQLAPITNAYDAEVPDE